tara:strand:- start:59 stop:208 length:150 start_codon:yes stop_codon:yes gene_type:complete
MGNTTIKKKREWEKINITYLIAAICQLFGIFQLRQIIKDFAPNVKTGLQ